MSGIKKVASWAFILGAVSALQTRPNGRLSEQSFASSVCNTDTECEMSNAVCNNDYSNCSYCDEGACRPGCSADANCQACMVCDGQHLCQQTCCPSYVVEIIVKTKSCSGYVTGTKEQGLLVQLTGLLGLTQCTTDYVVIFCVVWVGEP